MRAIQTPLQGEGESGSPPTTRSQYAALSTQHIALALPSIQRCNVRRQRLQILIGNRAQHCGHVARVVGAPPGLEVLQLLEHIFVMLAAGLRDFVLSAEAPAMAHAPTRGIDAP